MRSQTEPIELYMKRHNPDIQFIDYGTWREKTCLRGDAYNTGADQPAHMRSLISAFVIGFLESIISGLAKSEIFEFLDSLCS